MAYHKKTYEIVAKILGEALIETKTIEKTLPVKGALAPSFSIVQRVDIILNMASKFEKIFTNDNPTFSPHKFRSKIFKIVIEK